MTNYSAEDIARITAQPGYGIVTDATAVQLANQAHVIASGLESPAVAVNARSDKVARIPYANELDMQQAFLDALAIRIGEYPDVGQITAIPNQVAYGRRPAPGQRPGAADHFLPVPVGVFHGLWLEAKMPERKQSPAQVRFAREMRARGYVYEVWRDVDTAVSIVLQYLDGNYPPF